MLKIKSDSQEALEGRSIALVIAATGVFWIIATLLGQMFEVSNRTHALFDLVALAGFGFALVSVFKLWRTRQREDKGDS